MHHRQDQPTLAAAHRAVEQGYSDYDRAFVDRDVERILDLHSSNFLATLADGTSLGRLDLAERLAQQFAGYDSVGPALTTIEGLAEEADGFTAIIRRMVFHSSSDPHIAGRMYMHFDEERARDSWVSRRGQWRLERREALGGPSWGSVEPEPLISPRLARLQAEIARGDSAALDAFWTELPGGAPLVEPFDEDPRMALVTFIWRSERADPVTVGGGVMWTAIDKPLRRLGESDLWFHTETAPVTGRFNYWFRVRQRLSEPSPVSVLRQVPDPFNSRPAEGANWFELPEAPPQPYVAERADVPRGQLIHGRIRSSALGEERPYSVYLPAGYHAAADANRLVVLFDGELYGGGPKAIVPTPRIVDNLVAERRIPQVAVLLVHNLPGRRARELTCSPAFETFVSCELVPRVRDQYRAGLRPDQVVVGGSSNGGLAAAYCGLRHPDVLGNVLSMSGAFSYTPDWPPASSFPFGGAEGWMMRQFSDSPRLQLRFWLTVGRFELEIQLLTNRHLRSVLELKGYPVTYSEFDGGHTYAAWRGLLADGLIALLGESS